MKVKEVIKQPSRDGPTFGRHLSVPEKAAFERQRVRELKALQSGCNYDHCEALNVDSVGTRRSLEAISASTQPTSAPSEIEEDDDDAFDELTTYGFNFELSMSMDFFSMSMPPTESPTDKSISNCLARSCQLDYDLCLESSDCASYLSKCLQSGESHSEECQQYRSKAWLAVKMLVYCYDAQCGGDGEQSEREKIEEELIREWDEQDVCEDHPQNWHSCEENIHCLRDEHGDSWCQEEALVMCRDCAGPGEKCQSSKICQDELFFCDKLGEEEKAAFDLFHPCVVESCAVSHHSLECAEAVFDHCCNPDLENCERTERSSCTSEGCSHFSDPNSHHTIDYEKAACPFNDANGTCGHPSCSNDPSMFREIIDLFVGGGNGDCYGPWCFQQVMLETCQIENTTAPMEGGAFGTNTTTGRKLGEVMQRGRRLPHPFSLKNDFLSSFRNMQLPFQSRLHLQLINQNKEPDQRLRGHVDRRLETVEGGASENHADVEDSGECFLRLCHDHFSACQENLDCAYLMEYCSDKDDSEDCQSKDTSLLEPLEDCFTRRCHPDPSIRCTYEYCPAALKDCIEDDDCSYVIDNCVDSDGEDMEEHHGRSLQDLDPYKKLSNKTSRINATAVNTTSVLDNSTIHSITNNSEECNLRMNDATMFLMAPLQECHHEKCNRDIICVKESCPNMMKACTDMEDCNYVLFHCLDEPFGAECEIRFNAQVKEMVYSLMQCHAKHCSNDPILHCLYHDCDRQMEECHEDTECLYVLENCMDESPASDCETRLANTDTGTLVHSVQQCYAESCSHLDEHNEFLHILDQARQCLDTDEAGCAWAKEECETDDDDCGKSMSSLFECRSEECASQVVEENVQNKAFTEVLNCLGRECGVGGDDDADHRPSMNTREECAAVLSTYCTDNPNEKACQSPCPYGCKTGEFCPCTIDACQSVYAAPMCDRLAGPCLEYSEKLKQLYLSSGHYQPREEWNRNRLAHFLMDAPPDDLDIVANLPAELEALRTACNAVHANLAEDISTCMGPSIDFCNVNEWDQGCRKELSSCGDGIVSWHESCDDGNQIDGDGCSSWCYPDSGYICPEQGLPCEQCLRDERAEWGWGDESICKFCGNPRVNVTSPCFASACQEIEDYGGAKACDDHVEKFCAATLAAGLRDLGCDSYTKKSRMYTIPTVPNKCEYSIKEYNLNAKNIHKVKIAIFECKFEDPHGTLEDATPLFRYRHPLDNLSQEEQNSLSPAARAIIDAMAESREEKLIPLDELRLDDFFPYVHPSLATEGHPLHFNDPLARLVIHHEEPQAQERYDSWGNLNCHHSAGEQRELYSLPATSEKHRMALKAFLMKKRWDAMNNPYRDEDDEFVFDVDAIDAGEMGSRLKSTAIFGMKLSTTWKFHGHSGHVEEREDKEYICKDWNEVDWNEIENNPDCTSIEDNIQNGLARIRFGQNLFQAGCQDDNCDLKVDHCREIGLTPQRLEVNAEGFSQTARSVMTEIETMAEADSWPSLVEKFIRVSVAASTQDYDNVRELFNRLVVRGKKTKFMQDVPDYCEHDYYLDAYSGKRNPAWEADPCCNWELRQYQCCAPKDIPNGEIDVVLGINRAQVSTYCEGYSAEVENLLQDVMVNIDQALSCAEKMESSVSANVWDETFAVKDVCHQKIFSSVECEKDDDCGHCSKSTCRLQGTTGVCTVPWDDTEGCFLECIQNEMDPELVRYLREEWDVPATADETVFREAFVERMTEPSCSGPRAWEPDIGRNGYEWECDTSCMAEHLCDDWDYMEHLQQMARQEGHHDWIDFNNKEVCEAYNGTKNFWGQCEFASLVTSPCKQENHCYQECQKPHYPDGCAEMNGTWIQQPGESHGRCCPPDTHVLYDPLRNEKICSFVPEGSPNGWMLRSQECCEAENGDWTVINGQGGQCCLGRWVSHTYDGQVHQYCQTETWGMDMSECYAQCNELRKDCQSCRVDKMECCGEVYKIANRTACESYKECTDSSVWEGSGQTCDEPTPFCARCHGKQCYRTGEPPACFVNVQQQDCEGALEAISTEWDIDRHRCKVVTDSHISDWSCFGPSLDEICPDPTDYPRWMNDGLVPKTQWGEQSCNPGCYVPRLTDKETCQASTDYDAGRYYYWEPDGGNGNGVCKVYNVEGDADCAAISGGIYVPHALSLNSGRFSTEEECNEGECIGNLGWGGWSREQCKSSGKHSCTRFCPHCVTWNWPFNTQNHGACFSSNMTTCMNEGEPQVPCIMTSISESDCVDTNELQVEWISCSGYNTDSECNGGQDGLDPYAQLLGCSWHWDQCETEEACEAAGECNDWDNQRQECKDEGWKYGDTCWASYLVESTDQETQQITSTYEYASCNDCRHYDGVCVEPRTPGQGCDDQKWHKLGCRVHFLYDEASCKSANATYEWYTRAKTKDACLEIKGCKEPGRYDISELPPDQCTVCNGQPKSVNEWHGGVWHQPKVQNLTWMSEGTRMAPVNEWKPAIADYLLEKELAIPIIKRFAKKKQTQALLMFNVFTEALQTLACACGSGNRTNCFESTEGSVSGVSKAFCGLETPIDAACGTAVVKKSCLTEQERRLRQMLETNNTGNSMEITWTHYSAGVYGSCFEPYSYERELINPLAVKNEEGIVIGQLLGDGKGMISTGDFESVELCLERRADIREWDPFDVLDVGKRSGDGGMAIVPQYNTEWIANDGVKLCFIANSDGVYFPISRSNASWTDLNNIHIDVACDDTKSITVYNATSDMLVCLCRCGYYGDTCSAGCPNGCSGHGECLENGDCMCSDARTGIDCGEFNCPVGLEGKRCSGQGLCKEDATCECDDNYIGFNCSEIKILPQQVTTPSSFDNFQAPQSSVMSLPTSMPSDKSSVSGQPSGWPSSAPPVSVNPSSQPSMQPSNSGPMVSGQPSSQPSSAPSVSVNPSSQSSLQPSNSGPMVPGQPSSQPSSAPSVSGSPSSEGPTMQVSSTETNPLPSLTPSLFPSIQPAGQPSSHPSTQPSGQPSISPPEPNYGLVKVSIDVEVTLEGIDMADIDLNSLDNVVDLLTKVFKNALPEGAFVRILSVGGFSVTRRLLRFLQDDGTDVEFQIIMKETCDSATCSDAEANEISANLYQVVTADLTAKVESGELVTELKEEAENQGVSELSNVTINASTMHVSEAKVTVREAQPEGDDDISDDDDNASNKLHVTISFLAGALSVLLLHME
ncbi:hypothetical protein ACHAXR_013362 [Thalassiosira sp. AJA248-18]